jgi:FRG domain
MQHCDSLEQAIAHCHRMIKSGDFDIFRGQVSDWPLIPSAFRRPSKDRDGLEEFEAWVLKSFAVADAINSPDAMTATAQHYGIPTKLLDFTSSPEVAAFFATHLDADDGKHKFGYIFCGKSELIDRLPHCRLVVLDVKNLWRLSLQNGLFVEVSSREGANNLTTAMQVIRFKQPAKSPPASTVYPDRKSSLEVALDEYFQKRDAQLAGTHFTQNGGQHINYLIQTYPGVFPKRRNPGINDTWRVLIKNGWLLPADEHHKAVANRSTLSVSLPAKNGPSLRNALVELLGAEIAAAHRSGRFLTFELCDAAIENETLAVLGRQLELLWGSVRGLPLTPPSLIELFTNSISMTIDLLRLQNSAQADELKELEEGVVNKIISGYIDDIYWLRFGPHFGISFDGAVSKSAALQAVHMPTIDNLSPFYRKRIQEDNLSVFDFLTEPQHSFDSEPFIELFYAQILPTAFLSRSAMMAEDEFAIAEDYLSICAHPLRLGSVVKPSYGFLSPYASETVLERVVVFLPGMTERDAENEVIGAVHSFYVSAIPFTCYFPWLDERPIWEIDEACVVAKLALKFGLLGVLEVFSEDINVAIDPSYQRGSRKTGGGFGAFEVWLMATGRGSLLAGIDFDTLKTLTHELHTKVLPACNQKCQNLFLNSGGNVRAVHQSLSQEFSQ